MDKKINILFIYTTKASFVERDLQLLIKEFNVKEVEFPISKDLKTILKTPLKLVKMARYIFWADLTFSWFADIHSFFTVLLSKLTRRKSIVVVGGYEVARIPELQYGALINPFSCLIVKFIFKNADKVLTVDDGLKKDAINNIGVDGENILTVPTGYNYNKFKAKGDKECLVITVSAGSSWQRAKLKGLDTFIGVARYLPQVKFIVIGFMSPGVDRLKKMAPPNVQFIEQLPIESLIPYYQKAKIYCQFSVREGLPNVLCEAMLCECIPIGTDIDGIRTAIGDTGFYVPAGQPEKCADMIKKALFLSKGKEARNRIKLMFAPEKRETSLNKIIYELLT